jgi:hypothetical protein
MSKNDTEPLHGSRGMWGAFAGVITAALIAFPLSACVAFATHPASRKLFGERLANASAPGFSAFWWLLALVCAALPFLVGFGIARVSSRRSIGVLVGIVALVVIAVVVLGLLFVY